MKYLLIGLFLVGCTANQATPEKYKKCDNMCKNNDGIEHVKIFNEGLLFFDLYTSKRFDCKCKNGAKFYGLKSK